MVAVLSDPDTSYVNRSKYWMQLQPYLELFDRAQIEVITQEELQSEREETMRKAFAFAGVDESFTSEQFDREWEKSSAKHGDKYQLMEKLIKLPGFRSFDRNFDRLPESMRWIVEKVVHDPDKPPAREAEAARRPLRDAARPASARTSPGCRSSPAASSPAGTTTPEPRVGCAGCGGCFQILARPRSTSSSTSYRPWEHPHQERPFLAMNFAATLDGRAAIGGVSGPIGSAADTAMLAGLRTRFDAVMIGAGTMRAERYGRLAAKREMRERRERIGLSPEPLMVIVSGRLDLPWDAPLFSDGGRVLIFTASETEPPETETSLRVVRHEGRVDLAAALLQLRREESIRALLCEGGPRLHAQLQAEGLVDELFLTTAPKLSGGGGPPSVLEGELPAIVPLQLAWLLEEEGELFARYRHP